MIAHALSHLRLHVKGQPLFGAGGEKMQMAARGPEKVERAAECVTFFFREHAGVDIILRRAETVAMARHPEERVQIAQPALPFFDIGLDHVARRADTLMALIALFQLRGDERGMALLRDLFAEARFEFGGQGFVAGNATGFEQGGLDRVIFARELDRLVDIA